MPKFLTQEKYKTLKAEMENAEMNAQKSKADKIKVVLLTDHGHISRDIANILFLDLKTVSKYLNDYCTKHNLSI